MDITPLLLALTCLCDRSVGWAQRPTADSVQIAQTTPQTAPPTPPRATQVPQSSQVAQASAATATPKSSASGHSGTIKVARPSGVYVAQPGDRISSKDKLVTSDKANAQVLLRDGTALHLGERTQIDVRSFNYNPTTQQGNIVVGMLEGTMRMITGAIAKIQGNDVQVITKTSTIGARGTDFIVEASE
jgi:hypothetical protein